MSTTAPVSGTTASADASPDTSTRQFCTFYVGTLFFGVDVLQVQEVIRHQDMTRIPLAPGAVSGLINLRGQIVTAIDLRHRLGLPAKVVETPEDQPLNVVIRTPEGAISLLVDEIGDVMHVADDVLETPPPTLSEPARRLIDGVYKLDGQLLLVLNTTTAVDVG
jgi:purine-binding chemotaxis protein CheW